MQKRNTFIFLFLILITLSLAIFFLSHNNPSFGGAVNGFFSPIRGNFIGFLNGGHNESDNKEIAALQKAVREQKKQDSELKALRDQFDTQRIQSHNLLPAHIIGMSGYVPGVSLPEGLILDKGSKDGVKIGQIVVYKDNVIGKVEKVTDTTAKIMLIYSEKSTINAKTLKTNALGIVKGQGQGVMELSGVVLSEKLEKGDQVLTKGEEELDKTGYPPDLVIGKIVRVNKKASNLFQSAQVESLVKIQKLSMVFIMTGN